MSINYNDVPSVKPRRTKKVDVPSVHRTPHHHHHHQNDGDGDHHKTYSANFNSKRHHAKSDQLQTSTKSVDAIDDKISHHQTISRKYLCKENVRLTKENDEITMKFTELEELSVRKITKLREKIAAVENKNQAILSENDYIKRQYEELSGGYNRLKGELELSKHCRNCDVLSATLEQLGSEMDLVKQQNKELEEDLNMLKTVVFRLNLQIERYQEKLRKYNVKTSVSNPVLPQYQSIENILTINETTQNILSQDSHNHNHTAISWGKVNVHTLGPLLDAYQDTINEKDSIIHDYETEISVFTGKLKEIIEENEKLHLALTEDNECSAKLKLNVVDLTEELKQVKSQNDILIKKCAMKHDKIEEILKCYEGKIEQFKRDYSVAHEQYYKSQTEIVALKEKNKSLIDAQDDFRNERHNYIPVSVHTSSVNECKKWYEELKSQYEQEKAKLKETIETQSKLIDDLNKKIFTKTRETDEMSRHIQESEQRIKKFEAQILELEHTLNEVQLSRSGCRKQLHKAMNFSKELVAEQESLLKALNERQQETKAVKKIGFSIATRMDSLKSQLKHVQRDAWQGLTTVEKRIEDQTNKIELMKQEHAAEVERLQRIIEEEKGTNLLLQEHQEVSLPTTPHYLLFRDKHK